MTADLAEEGINATWSITSQPSNEPSLQVREPVMAWAIDAGSKQPVYVNALVPPRTGARCGCLCPSCGATLTAVNAGKSLHEMKMRPHFRHPDGQPRTECLTTTARKAALHLLATLGLIELPGHEYSIEVQGFDGRVFMARRHMPVHAIGVLQAVIRDETTAYLRLENGRELIVRLVGMRSSSRDYTNDDIAIIEVVLDDPEAAGLSPDELRAKLQLLVREGEWCSYWSDPILEETATSQPQECIRLEWDNGSDFPDLSGTLRMETLLHLKAKEVLAREQRIMLPRFDLVHQDTSLQGDIIEHFVSRTCKHTLLQDVHLELLQGDIRPDIVALADEIGHSMSKPLFIEVTVTNSLSEERLARIRAHGYAALEIDLSQFAGVVTEQQFTELVVDRAEGKRWIYHPDESEMRAWAKKYVDREKYLRDRRFLLWKKATETRDHFRNQSINYWASELTQALIQYADTRGIQGGFKSPALAVFDEPAQGLAIHGIHDGFEFCLGEMNYDPYWKLLSIRENRAVGFGGGKETAWFVINSFLIERSQNARTWHTLYLAAIRVYQPTLNPKQIARLKAYRQLVSSNIESGSKDFDRSKLNLRLIGLLFPELQPWIERSLYRNSQH